MEIVNQSLLDTSYWKEIFQQHRDAITHYDTPLLTKMRNEALENFLSSGIPDLNHERWRNTDIRKFFRNDWNFLFQMPDNHGKIEDFFLCEVQGFDTLLITLFNGWYTYKNSPLRILTDGTIIGGLRAALVEAPEIIERYLGRFADFRQNAFTSLCTAFASEGFFIYVPDGVQLQKPIQMVNVVNYSQPLFMQTRNLIIAGKGSSIQLLHCDDSNNNEPAFTNSLTEIYVGEGASVDYYKLQNINDHSVIEHNAYIHQEKQSVCNTYSINLHGGLIRNETYNHLAGHHAEGNHFGLYLMDKNQQADNLIFVDITASDCVSYELFKGVLDDYAHGVFNGHILVHNDGQRTQAYQSNRNILLTDKALVNTKPFLEIYADDVKCSHGATIGQLDKEAMFYLRSRGIDQDNARLLLMYAFAAEILNRIDIPALKDRLDDLVKKRLRGELSICDQCVLHCKNPEKPIVFDIDLSKL
ncbi:MAG TPA: Fe-S cluster assembly protein SufD [Bacteroidales bacterium]|jgi:Fe-S cluster assembly protein SufD|nr:Fe-S cluster assembly protein SufD [Bacteroidales bacterium]MDI9574298.1 Fe-S cluster assembly protein SufD [Bacteroidota bacterium]OQC59126.1 MAG: FeS cluster assembly protein SufD [Bacteroidetes bacterium ADurb.Bin012]MBP9512303.1 Fe-S cluster assembly protein SufD [Bacteroidales bacterium]MBP9588834.1 Fe-S cluster assembly protein SufD [Bacteroidales bacterium]